MIRVLTLIVSFSIILIHGESNYSCDPSIDCGCSTKLTIQNKTPDNESILTNTWSWIVSILLNWTNYCSGTLISSVWVVTTATCVEGYSPSRIILSIGTNNLFDWKQQRTVERILIHPDYDRKTGLNNIALIRLGSPFNMTESSINLICLPRTTINEYPPMNSSLVGVGWVNKNVDSDSSPNLKPAIFKNIPSENHHCNRLIMNSSTQLCINYPDKEKESCLNNSTSGPLMMFTTSEQWVFVGMISTATGCSNSSIISAHIRLAPYIRWFRSMNVTGFRFVTCHSPGTIIHTRKPVVSSLNVTQIPMNIAISLSNSHFFLLYILTQIISKRFRDFD